MLLVCLQAIYIKVSAHLKRTHKQDPLSEDSSITLQKIFEENLGLNRHPQVRPQTIGGRLNEILEIE